MIVYASHTGTRRNIAAMKAEGWRLLLTPAGDDYDQGMGYAIDNGAWRAFKEFEAGRRPSPLPDIPAFERLLERRACGADFIVAPDIVRGGEQSLALSEEWVPRLRSAHSTPVLVAVQDTFDTDPALADRVRSLVASADGIFVGGGTPWKEQSLPYWKELKHELGCYLHVARVNTARRMALCAAADADSVDGTSGTKFASTIPMLGQAARQPALIGF